MDCFVLLLSSISGYGAGEVVRFERCNECLPEELAFVKSQEGLYRVCYGYDVEPTEDIVAIKRNLQAV
jgi:hypothetical protein